MTNQIYFHNIPLDEAISRWNEGLSSIGKSDLLGSEIIRVNEKATGRVLSASVWAMYSNPYNHVSAMDGFAVHSSETRFTIPGRPVTLERNSSSPHKTEYVNTGDPLPEWADAVIPIELVETLDEFELPAVNSRAPEKIRLRSAVTPWSHVRLMGEDIVANQLVLPVGHVIRPIDLGAIAGSGNEFIHVARKPLVAILPTGSELIPPGQPIQKGDIIEFNSLVLAAQVNEWGGDAICFPIIPDDFEKIQRAVLECGKDYDLVLLIAGSSAGSKDFSKKVIESCGSVLIHGVAIRPGHPIILGTLNEGIPIIGVPGYPVSCAITSEIFIKPLLSKWLGIWNEEPMIITATLTRMVTSSAGDDDFLRVVLGRVDGKMLATPLAKNAGMISSIVNADGVIIIPRGSEGIIEGKCVNVRLYRSITRIERSIVMTGSHDISLDLIPQFLSKYNRRVVFTNTGSLGGLLALKKRYAHLAGSHLLDPSTGIYNRKAINEILNDVPVIVLAYAKREQGLIISRGNPKRIESLNDLTRNDVVLVNRQPGSGTRLLLDYLFGVSGILPNAIQGYDQVEYTHLAVGAAVASGRADCGLGNVAAARSLNLDFIPICYEDYELIIPDEYYKGELLAPLIDLLNDPKFKSLVAEFPGYDVTNMGTVITRI